MAAVSTQGLVGRCHACPRTAKGGPVRGASPELCADGTPEKALVRGARGAAVNEEVGSPSSAVHPL